jgi:mannose-1-phosphate guanylyltransferase
VELHGERISDFQEKPSREEARSDLINAGVYVFEPEIMDHIGPGNVSIEREVFPQILGRGLYGFKFDGYWVDCGTRDKLLMAQRILLELNGDSIGGCELIGEVERAQPNHIVGGVFTDCRIGPFVYAEEGVAMDSGSEARSSMLLKDCHLGRGTTVADSIIGPGVVVEPGAKVVGEILSID